MLQPGDDPPDLELEDTGGERFSLSEALERGPVVLVFFKVTCPTCQFTMPFLERLVSGNGPNAPALISISQDDVTESQRFRQRFGLSFRTLIDPGKGYSASNSYRITHVPSIFLIEPDAKISLSFDGFEKRGIEELGRRFGAHVFSFCDFVPANRPG